MLSGLREGLLEFVTALGDGSTLPGPVAPTILKELVAIERAAAAGKLIVQRRAVRANAWRTAGADSPETWLANLTGETTATAARSLTASDQLAGLPETARQLAEGRVSQTQAALVASGASADPSQERKVLLTAHQRDAGELGRQARAVRQAAAGSPLVDRERIFRSRYLRTWTGGDGAFEGRFRLTPDHGAIVQSALSEIRQAVFAQARSEGRDDPADAYSADALVELARQRYASAEPRGPKALVHVRVDRTALLRGRTVAGEVCEVDGIGPVAVATAQAFAEDAILEAVLTEAGRVVSVIPAGRSVPAAVRRLLLERDQVCVVPGCSKRRHLEIHHLVAYSIGGSTTIDNLVRLCPHHHDQITYHGAKLCGAYPHLTWTPPAAATTPSDTS